MKATKSEIHVKVTSRLHRAPVDPPPQLYAKDGYRQRRSQTRPDQEILHQPPPIACHS